MNNCSSKALPPGFPSTARFTANRSGFTLVELLMVVTIMLMMMVFAGPAFNSLTGAGTINKAAADFAGTLESARQYAMANRTHVRIAISSDPGKGMVVLPEELADGEWNQLGKPLRLEEFEMKEGIEASGITTNTDQTPSDTDIESFEKKMPGESSDRIFSQFIQFSPSGEASVKEESPARFIKVGIEKSRGQPGQVLIRMSGINGSIQIFREERLQAKKS